MPGIMDGAGPTLVSKWLPTLAMCAVSLLGGVLLTVAVDYCLGQPARSKRRRRAGARGSGAGGGIGPEVDSPPLASRIKSFVDVFLSQGEPRSSPPTVEPPAISPDGTKSPHMPQPMSKHLRRRPTAGTPSSRLIESFGSDSDDGDGGGDLGSDGEDSGRRPRGPATPRSSRPAPSVSTPFGGAPPGTPPVVAAAGAAGAGAGGGVGSSEGGGAAVGELVNSSTVIDCGPFMEVLENRAAPRADVLRAIKTMRAMLKASQSPEMRGLNKSAEFCNSVLNRPPHPTDPAWMDGLATIKWWSENAPPAPPAAGTGSGDDVSAEELQTEATELLQSMVPLIWSS